MTTHLPKSVTTLCIAQPWAHCIFREGKNVENRSQNVRKRGTVAIYASRTLQKERFEDCQKEYGIKVSPADVSFGTIVGFVDIVDVIGKRQVTRNTRKWFLGPYGYVLTNPIVLKTPIPAKPPAGAIQFWTLKGAPLTRCLSQLPARRLAKFKPFE